VIDMVAVEIEEDMIDATETVGTEVGTGIDRK
jgi:hypothetical protein